MKIKYLFNKATIGVAVAGVSWILSTKVLAQEFYFPSASFFSPFASYYESDENGTGVDLEVLLEQYPAFNSRLQQTDLPEVFEQHSYLTILVPSNSAFENLSPAMKEKLSNADNMKKLLQYHIVVGKIEEQDIQRRAVATSLEKNSVQITGVPVGNKVEVLLNKAKASEPLSATDGVVIPINQVLVPPELSVDS